jgi:multidrug efflux pump
MSLSTPFIHRPVGTTLLTIAIALAGILSYFFLPVAPLPQVDSPTISVSCHFPGASPETMASAVVTPLERRFGQIAGIKEMTSTSNLGSGNIVLVFDVSRDINGAARDVQAAINAAGSQLPANLPGKPSYKKVNPADAPIMIVDITSDIYDRGRMYDAASTILAQKLSQIDGIGEVRVGGGALPAVRVELNPLRLHAMGIGLDQVRTFLASVNVNHPTGQLANDRKRWDIDVTDQLYSAAEYKPLILAYRNGAAVRLEDVATVVDSVEDVRQGGFAGGRPAILLIIYRAAGANIIDTVDRVKAVLPQLQASIPAAMHMHVTMDRTTTIRASVKDVQFALGCSIGLVILVVFIFLREPRATLIPSVAVPVSLLGTFGVMYLAGYSIDNFSLMALAIATGFVVDDAIVVIENITRHIEAGMKPLDAALLGAKEIGFTVLSMSSSLVAVFAPIFFLPDYVGALFREFAAVLAVAVLISMVVSLTTTPMMCAVLLKHRPEGKKHGRIYRFGEWFDNALLKLYEVTLGWVLRHSFLMLMVTIATVCLTVILYRTVPSEFVPQQDIGRLSATVTADQNISSQAMQKIMMDYNAIIAADPAVEAVAGFSSASNSGRMFLTLKPLEEREGAPEIIQRLQRQMSKVPGATCILQAQQDIRAPGGRSSAALYQYTLAGDNLKELEAWAPKVLDRIKKIPGLAQVNSDLQNHGLESHVQIDRETAARLNLTAKQVDDLLYDAFGQRQVSTMYKSMNQYHVVMEAAPEFTESPESLDTIYAHAADGSPIPLSAFAKYSSSSTPLQVTHQSQFPCVTISFNLRPDASLSNAVNDIEQAVAEMRLPPSIQGMFAGTARTFQTTQSSIVWLIVASLIAVYIILGMLYESLIHPLTILSTLPSAGVGAFLALLVCHTPFSLIAAIGILLLIGIVKKNAIMMIDFALDAERTEGKRPRDAIFEACLLRFRPIMMTTAAALLGGLPLALGHGTGAELRRPLGIAIVGGLILSQMLTLYTTPVIYLYLDRMRWWATGKKRDTVLQAVPG